MSVGEMRQEPVPEPQDTAAPGQCEAMVLQLVNGDDDPVALMGLGPIAGQVLDLHQVGDD